MRASRLLTILITLQQRGRTTAAALADQLEVSKRTIYRDVDELSAAGVPIYADRGPAGGFALLDGFRTELTGLTGAEADALLFAGVPMAAADLGLAGAASAARLKLLAALPESTRASARQLAERFHLDPVDWYRRARPPAQLGAVAQAVWHQRCLRIRYQSWTRTTTSTIRPLGLVLKAGRWYCVAIATSKPRIYRLDRIQDARPTGEGFDRPDGFDLPAAWRRSVEGFETGLKRDRARIRLAPAGLDRLDALGSDIAEPLDDAAPDAEGWRQAWVPIETIDHAAGLFLGFGDALEILEPAALAEEVARRAAAVVALYRRSANASRIATRS